MRIVMKIRGAFPKGQTYTENDTPQSKDIKKKNEGREEKVVALGSFCLCLRSPRWPHQTRERATAGRSGNNGQGGGGWQTGGLGWLRKCRRL